MASPEHLTGQSAISEDGSYRTVADLVTSFDDTGAARHTAHRTGFGILDEVMEGGLRAGDLTIVGGAPGVGKTIATLQWARNLALEGRRVVYACYEHDQRSLFGRLLQLEAGQLPKASSAQEESDLRRVIRDVARGELSLHQEVAASLRLRAAFVRLEAYASKLALIGARSSTDIEALTGFVGNTTDRADVLFVDYLQKVPVHEPGITDDDHATRVAEGLKELALSRGTAVVAVTAGDREGLTQRRLRMHHLRGAAGLSYESDVIILLNEKFSAVSKAHTAYDPFQAERFKQQVVFTVEKNRDGPAPIDVEFTKDFEHYRFVPDGGAVRERLIDERLFAE